MKQLTDLIIDSTLEKYDVPLWVKPYIVEYVKKNPANTIKFATSFIDIKRKKGEVTKKYVKLPNGVTFKIESVVKLLNLFYYGEDSATKLTHLWTTKVTSHNAEYIRHYSELYALNSKHTKAVKNLIEGLGYKIGEPSKELEDVFNYVSNIDEWEYRIIATSIVLRHAYANTFGQIFYRIFYPTSPEFMRNLGKAFEQKNAEIEWGMNEAKRLVRNNLVDHARVIEMTRNIQARVLRSIDTNMHYAKSYGIENEVKLLRDIAIAYPFHTLANTGVRLDVRKEVEKVRKEAGKVK